MYYTLFKCKPAEVCVQPLLAMSALQSHLVTKRKKNIQIFCERMFTKMKEPVIKK